MDAEANSAASKRCPRASGVGLRASPRRPAGSLSPGALACASLAAAMLLCGCAANNLVSGRNGDYVKLNIPDRPWDPQRPDTTVGWCAEACIQMAMAYYGREVSQAAINRAGNPTHPDLWMNDVDVALDSLGVTYARWQEGDTSLNAFVAWISQQLRAGLPVLCGIKLYPDEHPEWFLDHFVLAVGFNRDGLFLNTNMEGQLLLSYQQLASYGDGFSFRSTYNHYFGRAITGLR